MPITLPLSKLMAQATALTRNGRLAEATQALQRALHIKSTSRDTVSGSPGASPAARRAGATTPSSMSSGAAEVLDGLARVIDPLSTRPAQAPRPAPQPASRPVPRPAPAQTPDSPARFEEQSLATELGVRQYKLYNPSGLADDTPVPLVVMLHGCKQSPDDFAAGTRMNALAEEQGFRVLYPAQPPRSNAARCWNWFQPGDQKRGSGEPAALAAIVRQVMQSHAVDDTRIYVAGLSAGGSMATILANEYPDLFAAAGVHSGLPQGAAHDVPTAFAAMKSGPGMKLPRKNVQPVPTIVFHGDHDTVVSPRNGELLMTAWDLPTSSTEGSANGRDYVRSVYEDAAGRTVAEHWLVNGAAHTWSGGHAAGSYTDESGPDATREMLRFFMLHQRR